MNKNQPSEEKMDDVSYPFLTYIQFDESNKAYLFGTFDQFRTGDQVVVETARGQEIGRVYAPSVVYDESLIKGEIKPILRMATKEDLERRKQNEEKAKYALHVFQESIARLNLDMHLISCEYTLDRSKVIFTYVSDERVDFRQLLKDLASQLSCRIELRQVGPRNKAKLVGGIGNCGMECCCSRFMTGFDTVSINMAKNQMLALNISKLSGQCGKLMCCLRFENDAYTELKKGLPRVNSSVEYNGNRYRLASMNVLQRTAKLENREEVLFVSFDELWPAKEENDEPAKEL